MRKWNKNVISNIDQAIKKSEAEREKLNRINESRDLNEVEVARKLALQSYLEKWYVRK